MRIFSYVFMYAYEQVISYLYFDSKYKSKAKGSLIFLAFLCSFAIQFGVYFFNIPGLNILSFLLCNLLISTFVFKAPIKKCIFDVLILEVIMAATEYVVIYGADALHIASLDNVSITQKADVMLIEAFASKTLYFIVTYLMMKLTKVKNKDADDSFSFALFLMPLSSLIVMFSFAFITTHIEITDSVMKMIIMASLISLIANIAAVIVHEKSISLLTENTELQLVNQKTEINNEYYRELEMQNQLADSLIHDIKRHLNIIQALSLQNDNDGINEYIKSVQGSSEIKNIRQYSENKLVNIIITRYAHKCASENIEFFSDIRFINFDFIEMSDITTILGNILENAYEAAVKSHEKYISVFAERKNENYIIIRVINSSDTAPSVVDGTIQTTKSDLKNHGIGLKTVRKTLKKYSGDLDWEYDEKQKMFSLTVMIYNPERT